MWMPRPTCKKPWTSYTTRKRAVRPCATPPRFAWFTGTLQKRSCPRWPRVWPVNRWSFGLCPRAAAVIPGTPAGPEDFDTEFLDYILAVKVVDSVQDAAAHIAAHSTGHSEAIVTEDAAAADAFCAAVDSAAVYVNASTRFTDGGEFGLGCEMGISTQKLGARGPMGLAELTSYKYIIRGNGQVR